MGFVEISISVTLWRSAMAILRVCWAVKYGAFPLESENVASRVSVVSLCTQSELSPKLEAQCARMTVHIHRF